MNKVQDASVKMTPGDFEHASNALALQREFHG